MIDVSKRLEEVGEFALIRDLVLPLAREHGVGGYEGDDCAFLPAREGYLAFSADTGPKPLLQSVPGYEEDYESAGWLGAVATISDLATAGVIPLSLTNCIDAPAHTPVSVLHDYLLGYFRACKEFGFSNAGGDIRQNDDLSITVFGTGQVQGDRRIGRSTAKRGSRLVLLGRAGQLMASFLIAIEQSKKGQSSDLDEDLLNILRAPRPQIVEMAKLAAAGVIESASDTSDGLIGALINLTDSSNCGFDLELSSGLLEGIVTEASSVSGFDPWNIFFCWGDWSVAATISQEHYDSFLRICESNRFDWVNLGTTTSHVGVLRSQVDGGPWQKLNPIRSENFTSTGFNAGLKASIEYMLSAELFER